MEIRPRITVSLRQTEIDCINLVALLAHKKVAQLDITVDKGPGVNVLNAGDELIRE
jgi:hypothetical protein